MYFWSQITRIFWDSWNDLNPKSEMMYETNQVKDLQVAPRQVGAMASDFQPVMVNVVGSISTEGNFTFLPNLFKTPWGKFRLKL